mgnify:CR=1 FL=1
MHKAPLPNKRGRPANAAPKQLGGRLANDEARGTSHLDFFKFVGRVVGKALYDGQYIDAYFTRSFYKHALGQPLTYEVRAPTGNLCTVSKINSIAGS